MFRDFPLKIIKDLIRVYSHRLTIIFNKYLKMGKFPGILKYTVTSISQKGNPTDESNYKLISFLSNFQIYLRNLFMTKSIQTWNQNFLNT